MRKFCPPVSASPKPRSHPLHRLETTQGMETTARQSLGSRCRRPVPPPLKRTSPPGIKCYSCCLEDWLHEQATISWLHYARFAAESFGIAAAQRSPDTQRLGWQTQNKQTVSSKSITQPHSKPLDPLARLKRGPLDVEEQMQISAVTVQDQNNVCLPWCPLTLLHPPAISTAARTPEASQAEAKR